MLLIALYSLQRISGRLPRSVLPGRFPFRFNSTRMFTLRGVEDGLAVKAEAGESDLGAVTTLTGRFL